MRIMTIQMEVNDEEAANLLNRFAERGAAVISETTNVVNNTTSDDSAGVDVKGVPWDSRYHATTKTKKADGTWKAAKGMSDATKAEAAAFEASFANPTPAAPAAPVAEPAAPAAPVAEPAAPAAPVAEPAAPAAPAAPVAPTAPVAPEPVSFEQLTAGFGEVIARIGQDTLMSHLGQIYADAGVDAEGTSLQTNETQRSQVLAAIQAL